MANWFWQPDTAWVNTVNTTSLRTINGIRMAVAFMALGGLAFAYTTYQAFPWHMEPCTVAPCLEPIGRARAADFAKATFDSMGLFLAAVIGIAVGAYGVKRITDTDHVERKEQAKKAPITNMITAERPAVAPVTIRAEDQSTVKVETAGAPTVGPVAETPEPEPEWATGEPKAGIL